MSKSTDSKVFSQLLDAQSTQNRLIGPSEESRIPTALDVARAIGEAEAPLWQAIDRLREAAHRADLKSRIDTASSAALSRAERISELARAADDLLEEIRIERWRGLGVVCEHALGIAACCSRCAAAASEVANG